MCIDKKPTYLPHSEGGILTAISRGDGYTIAVSWNRAYPDTLNYQVAYNLYYSTIEADVFSEGVKFVSISPTALVTEILDLTPGDTFYFAVRATEYDPAWYDLSLLPDSGSSKIYPEGLLLQDLSATSTAIPITDLSDFPSYGIVQIGYEIIQYLNKDIPTNSLTGLTRGFLGSNITEHLIDGYDGYRFDDPLVHFWKGHEDDNYVIFEETSRFVYPNYARTNADGYKNVAKDILTTDLGASDASQQNFQAYDYSGWHRTDPVALLRGDCVGSYFGGQQFCADGYDGIGRMVRGISIQEINDQRQEVLLNTTGEPCCLFRRMRTGIRCSCFLANNEYPEDRCPNCNGTGFIMGYEQFFNPRRSDGRIMVRFDPTKDDLRQDEAGLESVFLPNCRTLVVPGIKDRDFIIRFNEDDTEEFRYEVLDVTRNKLLLDTLGAQQFTAQRVRKTDPIYQVRAFRNTATMPQTLTTQLGMVPGPGGIPPHTHSFVVNENTVSLSQINQTTSINQGHTHSIVNGIVQPALGHTHVIIYP